MTKQDFFEKNDAKNGQKTNFFGLFKEIKLSVLSAIGVKRTFLWSFNIYQKLHAWEKSGSQVMAKNGSVFFNRQYFINRYLTLIFEM